MHKLDALLEPVHAETKVPALAAAVVEKNKLVALGAVGKRQADREDPIRHDDRFHIGSCTKSMTATMVARLVEMGKLDWRSMVAEVLPTVRKDIRREYWKVTIEQLLTHRSGLPDDRAPNPQVFLKLWGLSSKQRLQAAEIILQQEPVARPGERTIYSNGGYVVAGAMAEAVTGKTWEELMNELLFRPLGMKSAGFGAPATGAWGHRSGVDGYLPVPPSPFADNPPVLGPAGTVHLSLSDWARYAIVHLRGAVERNPPVLRQDTFAKLHTPPEDGTYAMGWGIARPTWARGRVLQHAGSNTMWFAQILLVPDAQVGFLITTNAADEKAMNAVRRVVDLVRAQYVR
ncbi:MAG: serine hydrolase [Armatimonadota bacterium]|nr:MAG: serine hydrolase [Armatimonadota bacterium]